MGGLLAAIAAPLIGGIFAKKEQKAANKATAAANRETLTVNQAQRDQDRWWYLEDRQNERDYSDHQMRSMMQLADAQAERAAATRGIDFQKLRDQAQAAGFNPLTALGNAGAYSTEVGYSGPQAAGGGVSSFAASGGGYQAMSAPQLSSASFVADAVQRAADAWTNRPPEQDALDEAMNRVFHNRTLIEAMDEARSVKGGFGYDLQRQTPYRAPVSVHQPKLGGKVSSEAGNRIVARAASYGAPTGKPESGAKLSPYKGRPAPKAYGAKDVGFSPKVEKKEKVQMPWGEWLQDPRISPAHVIEDQLGDTAGLPIEIMKGLYDLDYNTQYHVNRGVKALKDKFSKNMKPRRVPKPKSSLFKGTGQ